MALGEIPDLRGRVADLDADWRGRAGVDLPHESPLTGRRLVAALTSYPSTLPSTQRAARHSQESPAAQSRNAWSPFLWPIIGLIA
jgi:hypothetical protein